MRPQHPTTQHYDADADADAYADASASADIFANIDALLRADAAYFQHEHIANDHFSANVMAQVARLPAQGARLSLTKRLTIIAAAALIAMVIAVTAGAGDEFLVDVLMDLATRTFTPAVVILAVLLLGGYVMALAALNEN